MKNTVLILFSLLIGSTACALTPPVITNTAKQRSVVLGADAEKALKQADSDFQLYSLNDFPKSVQELFIDTPNNLPMAIMGDFNGDNISDIIVLGHNKTHRKAFVLIAMGNTYLVTEFRQVRDKYVDPKTDSIVADFGREVGLATYLSFYPQEELKFAPGFRPRDAFQLETFQGMTHAYYMNNTGVVLQYFGLAKP